MVDIRRATPAELRNVLIRVRGHLVLAKASGLEDLLGQGCKVPSDSTSFLLMTAQVSGAGSSAGRVAMESADRLRLSRAPRMKYKFL